MRTLWLLENSEFSRIHAALAAKRLGLQVECLPETEWPLAAGPGDLIIAAERSPDPELRARLRRFGEEVPGLQLAILSPDLQFRREREIEEAGLHFFPKPLTTQKLETWLAEIDGGAGHDA